MSLAVIFPLVPFFGSARTAGQPACSVVTEQDFSKNLLCCFLTVAGNARLVYLAGSPDQLTIARDVQLSGVPLHSEC